MKKQLQQENAQIVLNLEALISQRDNEKKDLFDQLEKSKLNEI